MRPPDRGPVGPGAGDRERPYQDSQLVRKPNAISLQSNQTTIVKQRFYGLAELCVVCLFDTQRFSQLLGLHRVIGLGADEFAYTIYRKHL